jgi:preprotein translocase subunit SecA
MNKQREAVYGLRHQLLEGLDQKELILEDYVANLLSAAMEEFAPDSKHPDEWDVNGLKGRLLSQFGLDPEAEGIHIETLNRHELGEAFFERIKEKYGKKEAIIGGQNMRFHERMVMLNVLDGLWKDHLLSMDHLKEGIGLRGYGQQDPLVAYKKESFYMFEAMMGRFQEDTVRYLFLMQIVGPDGKPITEPPTESAVLPPSESPEVLPSARPSPPIPAPARRPATIEGNGSSGAPPPVPVAVPRRALSTTIDELEQQFQRKKKRELEQARMAGANGASETATQRRTGKKVGRNEPCPCGSGKKYKACHGKDA